MGEGVIFGSRIVLMAINEIIKQIDAYLALLRRAREILSGEGEKELVAGIARPGRSTRASSQKLAVPSGKSAVRSAPTRRNSAKGRTSSKNPAFSGVQAQAPLPEMLDPGPRAVLNSDGSDSSTVIVKRLPARHRVNANQPSAHRSIKAGKQDSGRPTSLSSGMGSRIVVISAEQARLERERLEKPAVLRPRSLGSGSTGRLAFEALFSQ